MKISLPQDSYDKSIDYFVHEPLSPDNTNRFETINNSSALLSCQLYGLKRNPFSISASSSAEGYPALLMFDGDTDASSSWKSTYAYPPIYVDVDLQDTYYIKNIIFYPLANQGPDSITIQVYGNGTDDDSDTRSDEEIEGDANGDSFPGIANYDDDGDGGIDFMDPEVRNAMQPDTPTSMLNDGDTVCALNDGIDNDFNGVADDAGDLDYKPAWDDDEDGRIDEDLSIISKYSKAIAKANSDVMYNVNLNVVKFRVRINSSYGGSTVGLREIEFTDTYGMSIERFSSVKNGYFKRAVNITLKYGQADIDRWSIAPQDEDKLSIYYYDESARTNIKLGGNVDKSKKTVSTYTDRMGSFHLFAPKSQSVSQPYRWNPNPFSPNGDGRCDNATLTFTIEENSNVSVNIYDINGKYVKNLIDNQPINASVPVNINWNGSDESNNPVKIGPYIYQIEYGKKVINGVIVVVK